MVRRGIIRESSRKGQHRTHRVADPSDLRPARSANRIAPPWRRILPTAVTTLSVASPRAAGNFVLLGFAITPDISRSEGSQRLWSDGGETKSPGTSVPGLFKFLIR